MPDISILNGYTIKDATARQMLHDYNEEKSFNKTLDIKRTGRFIDRFGYESTNRKLGAQCCTYRDSKYYLSGNLRSDNTLQSICVYDENGLLITYNNSFTQLGHANDITATDNYLLIADGSGPNISVVERDNLTFVKKINLPEFRSIYGISNDNEHVYFAALKGPAVIIAELTDISSETYEQICSFSIHSNSVIQNFTVKDGYAYMLYNRSNMIYKIDMTSGNLINTYNIPDGDGYFPVGECECIFKKDNKIIISTAMYYESRYFNADSNLYTTMAEIFETDLTSFIEKTNDNSYLIPQHALELTVNGTGDPGFNPIDNFNTIEEACFILNYFKAGSVIFRNINNVGYAQLNDGIYTIKGSSGDRILGVIELKNTSSVISQIAFTNLLSYNSIVNLKAVTPVNMEFKWSDVQLSYCIMTNLNKIVTTRSTVKYIELYDNVPYNAVISQPENISCGIDIKTKYRENIMLLVKGTGDYGILNIYKVNSSVSVRVSPSYMNATSWTLPVVDNSVYNEIKYNAGVLSLKQSSNNSYITLDSTDIVHIII